MKNHAPYKTPVLPVKNVLVFPGNVVPIRVGRAKSIEAVKQSQAHHKSEILLLLQKTEHHGENVSVEDLHTVGTLCKIEKIRGTAEHGFEIIIRGIERFRTTGIADRDGFIQANGDEWKDTIDVDDKTKTALLGSLKSMAREILHLLPADTSQLDNVLASVEDVVVLSHTIAANMEMPLEKRQQLLETVSLKDRVLALMEAMQNFKESLEVQKQIREKLTQKLGKYQRDAILREQRKAIDEELGDGDQGSAADEYRKKIEAAGMPDEVKKIALNELKRFEQLGQQSPETHVIRNYLDLLVAMPWSKSGDDAIDVEKARKVLDDDHYGLDKIKKRIIQHLSVMKLKKDKKGSILLFVGPPGVGKTSLGQSIAKALGRKYVRASLGGVRDESEIRGHRRTYIGAMPGRIIQAIKRAGTNNPVFILDEIDKLGMSFQGDPASALLEVLDPEQNANFLDHYLDVAFDLSKVFFIATANSLETIPGPLRDRMEVIELSGYTTPEKFHIAKTHLVPKQLKEHGLTAEQLVIDDDVLMKVITHHTRESGVRELQRKIAEVARASTEKVVAKDTSLPVRVGLQDLEEVLGPERFLLETAEKQVPPGVVTGLAWTPMGGEILFIESQLMPGTGRLILTGQMGDVMKESAQIALSVVRSNLPTIAKDLEFEKKDLHMHIPAGAIPKDGPSAGIAMMTTIASLFSGKPVNTKLAMTGEITLRGAVMPVGGIREKIIGAHRAGIQNVILPSRNKRDLKDVPEEVKSQIRFDFVDTAAEVLKLALDLDVIPQKTAQPSVSPHGPTAVARSTNY